MAQIVEKTFDNAFKEFPSSICFGGTHYSEKFTNEVINGKFALGTVIPKYALEFLDKKFFEYIVTRNKGAIAALLDWNSLGRNKQKIIELLSDTELEVIRV